MYTLVLTQASQNTMNDFSTEQNARRHFEQVQNSGEADGEGQKRGRGGSLRFAHYPRRVHELSVNWKSAEAMPATAAQTSALMDGDIAEETLFGFVMYDPRFFVLRFCGPLDFYLFQSQSNIQTFRQFGPRVTIRVRQTSCRLSRPLHIKPK